MILTSQFGDLNLKLYSKFPFFPLHYEFKNDFKLRARAPKVTIKSLSEGNGSTPQGLL